MSTYSVYSNSDAGIKAVAYEVRISQVVVYSDSPFGYFIRICRYDSGTLSGTSVTPIPLRQGAPAASATAVSGVTVSGTQRTIQLFFIGPGETLATPSSSAVYHGASAQFQPPLAVTISPGSVFVVNGQPSDGTMATTIYFEELRLAGSY